MTSSLSIFGECSGNVRSTPTPNEFLRTVKVSRAPAPWRLITIPSNTWIRCRAPSITRKWTRTVSPALKRGTSRNWRRSMSWMIVLMSKGGRGPRAMVAESALDRPATTGCPVPGSADRDAVRRPVRGEHLPDQVLAWDGAPGARVAGGGAVVAHHEELVLGDPHRRDRPRVAAVGEDVRLVQALAVDVHVAAALLPLVAGEPDQPLDERAARAAARGGERRRVEDDDLVALRLPDAV